jgi:hypothetical protein
VTMQLPEVREQTENTTEPEADEVKVTFPVGRTGDPGPLSETVAMQFTGEETGMELVSHERVVLELRPLTFRSKTAAADVRWLPSPPYFPSIAWVA